MAMTTYFQMVSKAELDALLADPTTINELDQPEEQCAMTQLQQSLCFFLCGDAYPNPTEHGPLAGGLTGYQNVETNTLENGSFDVVPKNKCEEVADALQAVDLDKFKRRIAKADVEGLVEEEELYDLEACIADGDDLGELLSDQISNLRAFYADAAEQSLAVVLYTT